MSRWRPQHPDPATASTGTAQRTGIAPRCVWPKCNLRVTDQFDVHLCENHALHVQRTVAECKTYKDDAPRRAREAVEAKIDAGEGLDPSTDKVPGWIYYIRIDDAIKIGYAKNVAQRMRHYPPTAKLLAVEPGTYKLEKVRHSLFYLDLAWGREWFRPSPHLEAWIEELRRHYGDPSGHAYQYTTPERVPVVGGRKSSRKW